MATREKPACKYGAKCYRKNPDHVKKFSHPRPSDPTVATPGMATYGTPAAPLQVDAAQYPQPPLAQQDSSVLDLAFAMDCTGSMGSYIHQAQQNIRSIVEEIVAAEKSDVRLALVQYRDHPPQESSFVTDVLDFTPSVNTMKQKLDGCSAQGGGDGPEAVADALHQVLKLNWREGATKICVMISDAPPHGLGDSGDGFPDGCPDRLDPMQTTNELASKGVTLYMVGCEPSILPYKDFFMALAHITGGQYVPLGNSALLAKVIIGGVQEEITLERLMAEVEAEVQQEAAAASGAVSEQEMTRRVHGQLQARGARAKKLHRNQAELAQASARAQEWSAKTSMGAVKKEFVAAAPDPARMMRGAPRFMATSLGSAAPAPPGAAMMGGEETYEIAEEEVSMGQANRMVNKAMARHKVARR